MGASTPEQLAAREMRTCRGVDSGKLILAVVCLAAGIIPFARWIPGDLVPIAYTVFALAFALFARTRSVLRKGWELAFAFAIFGLVSVLDRFVNGYFGPSILHHPPNGGDPLASTVSGTVVIQLLDSVVAIVPIVALTRISGRDLGSIFIRKGVAGRWLLCAIVVFVVFYAFLASLPLRPDSPARRLLPQSGTLTLAGFFSLTPALLVLSISNGFEEELLFEVCSFRIMTSSSVRSWPTSCRRSSLPQPTWASATPPIFSSSRRF